MEGLDPYYGVFTTFVGGGWFDRNLCPNVRILLREVPKIPPASYSGFRFSTDESPLQFIPLLLPGSPIKPRGYRTANEDANDLFEICKSRFRSGGNNCAVSWLDESNYFIKYYDLIGRIQGKNRRRDKLHGTVDYFETWLDVDVIWDKNGTRIDGLPDLRGFVWWKEWADTCQLPPSQRPVILETCTEYPEREFARDRPWNIVNINSEASDRENSVSNNTETTATQSADTNS
ncbi:uncharacterized protein PV07_12480 [Cladophialophora immunda]|uniref:Uncharacterized protein n=1 Tax=Cladophialophora immunda TaxID=569365 RepID=A0A0D2CF24_9EURO|nr:uncharacterized protein PV07_12480 [Cladophialophora immunda]KIW22159.1 hypothetical protein PV07_12480 [Cladophialophora immunda]